MSQTAYVGTTPLLSDTIVDGSGQTVDLTGAVATLVYRPFDQSLPAVSLPATIALDQSIDVGRGYLDLTLGSPIMDSAAMWEMWWHVEFQNGAVLETSNFAFEVVGHGPGPGLSPYLTPTTFRRITRVKLSKLGIATAQDPGDELLQTELDRASAYVEFVTGQPATSADQPVLATSSGSVSPGSTGTLIKQAIQMRTEQVTFQAQNAYVDDASDDVISNFSVGGYSQSKSDPGRRGEQRQLNSWQALSNLLWLLMTPERYFWWVMFLSGDAHFMIGPEYSFENTIEPSWGYQFGLADGLIGGGYALGMGIGLGGSAFGGLDGHTGIGGWQGNLGGLPGGVLPLETD